MTTDRDALVKRLQQWERGVKFADESEIPLDSTSLLKLLADCIAALQPAGEQEAVATKPYAIEAGFSNFDGTWSVLIKRLPLNLADHEARIADVQWPSKLLYTTPPSERRLALEEAAKVADSYKKEDGLCDNGMFLCRRPADSARNIAAAIRALAAQPERKGE